MLMDSANKFYYTGWGVNPVKKTIYGVSPKCKCFYLESIALATVNPSMIFNLAFLQSPDTDDFPPLQKCYFH